MDYSTVTRDFAPTAPDPAVLAKNRRRILEGYKPPTPPPHPSVEQHHPYDPDIPTSDGPASVPFEDCRTSFAIDISQSTIGPVLAEECAFIENFVGNLSDSARGLARVIPWDEISHPIITVEGLGNIKPAGRTDPNVLLQNKEHIDLLQSSNLWFLLTDGEIVPKTVHRFAFSINSRSLHGTACIIVIFGKLPQHPTLCNVSVGISVFAVTPNCLFVFHDVETHLAYILQCKGCFNSLLPEGRNQTSLNSSTQWYEIPKLNYADLFAIRIPLPAKLDVNQFQLQSGEKVDLEDLYRGKVDSAIEDKILQNDDDLKSVILTATTRGQNREVRDWIASRRDSFADLVNMPRPDVNGSAAYLVNEAIKALQASGWNVNDFVFAEAQNLRRAHARNWQAFQDSVAPRAEKATQRGTIIDDGLARLALIGRGGSSSAECMSPISPGGGSSPSYRRERAVDQGPCSKLLPSTGYIRKDRAYGKGIFTCPICQARGPDITVLLKCPPKGTSTPGFPPPHSRADVAFPFALSGFVETDIVSDLTCCPACSVHILYASDPHPIVGVLVFGWDLSPTNTINQRTWMSNIDRVLEGRIATDCLLQVFFGILFAAQERDKSTDTNFAISPLLLAWQMMASDLQFQYESGNHHWTGRATEIVEHHMSMGIASPGCDFLNHPIDSFVVIICASFVPKAQKTNALFCRLAFHVIEYSSNLQNPEDAQVAAEFCTLLRSQMSNGESANQIVTNIELNHCAGSEVPIVPFTLLDLLVQRQLIDGQALRIFRQARVHGFDMIEDKCEGALCLFVCLFHALNISNKEPRQVLHWYCTRPELSKLFQTPWQLTDDEVSEIWSNMT
ncbi:hypothetical protein BKA64DRAFT_440088 [Cadophora sp. MPI-SDFR-AT-0126]|nr:hypothetical protein BKA64DRAFT_440088 [Leotiomycetes sp. MPI-SDFR-AT-0126]